MHRLVNEIRHYAWGSRDFIACLLGRPAGEEPEAELWLGAHPLGSSAVEDGRLLKDLIAEDPAHHLGDLVDAEYHARLPFLLKVLAAEHPLSLQAHPSAAQAKAGFAHEEQASRPAADPQRSYRDPYAKPELFVALTRCEVLCGFRPAAEAADILSRLGISSLSAYVASLLTGRAADGLRVVVTTLLSMPVAAKAELAARAVEECRRIVASDDPGPHVAAYEWAVRLGEQYPGDIGAVLSLLLNLRTLEPGQGMFVAAGMMHAYLRGAGIEAQANSDNTLRGGLTPKHVDVAELLKILDFEPTHELVIEPREVDDDSPHCAGARTWPIPAREFALFDWSLDGDTKEISSTGPAIALCIEGEVVVASGEQRIVLKQGESVYVAHGDPQMTATGTGRLVHIIVGQVPRSR